MSEVVDQPNAGADSREHLKSLDVRNLAGDLSSSSLPGCSGPGWRVLCGHWDGGQRSGAGLLLRPFEAVICAESAHLNVDECGAPERVLGAKLLTVALLDGNLIPGQKAYRERDQRVTGGLSRDRQAWRAVR